MFVLGSLVGLLFTAFSLTASAQGAKPTVAVLHIDTRGIAETPEMMGHIVRLELEKTKLFSVLDRYEVADILAKNKMDAATCLSRACLVEVGQLLHADKMLSGSAELMGNKIAITLRLIDVRTGAVEKTDVMEYLNLPELQKMAQVSVARITGQEPDHNMVSQLASYDLPIKSPKNRLRLTGPRLGFSVPTGQASRIVTAPRAKGGFEMYRVTSSFGWQQEIQYASANNFQGLIENIFLVSGLECGRFIPSYSPMLGFRFGKGAWEFAFGPTFRYVRKADGFYDTRGLMGAPGEWYLADEWSRNNIGKEFPADYNIVSRLDSRGRIRLSTGLVIGVGKTFRSGYLNIPVNLYIAPRKDGTTIGANFGFNAQKRDKE